MDCRENKMECGNIKSEKKCKKELFLLYAEISYKKNLISRSEYEKIKRKIEECVG